jgi:hypothetical protein
LCGKCAGHRYECAGSPCNAQGLVEENLNIFSTTVTFMLMNEEKNSVLLVIA